MIDLHCDCPLGVNKSQTAARMMATPTCPLLADGEDGLCGFCRRWCKHYIEKHHMQEGDTLSWRGFNAE